MPNPKTNRIVGIIAPIGTGKTTECVRRIREFNRVVIFDTLGEDAYALTASEIVFGNPARLAEEIALPRFCVAYRTVNLPEGFEHAARLVYLCGDCLFVIEEIDQVCSAGYESQMLHSIINYGRHRQVSVVYLSRRFATVSRSLTANTQELVFFKVTEPIDLDGISERCGKEVAERVQGLRALQIEPEIIPGQILIWKNTGEWSVQDVCETISDRNNDSVSQRKSAADDHSLSRSPEIKPATIQQNGGENQTGS